MPTDREIYACLIGIVIGIALAVYVLFAYKPTTTYVIERITKPVNPYALCETHDKVVSVAQNGKQIWP